VKHSPKLMIMRFLSLLICLALPLMMQAAEPSFHSVPCEGTYPLHLQGVCTNQKDALFWSWTNQLVKTDLDGKLLRERTVATHHGDLCYEAGKVYVAVNLGKFNLPAGKEDSWVYVYDAGTLDELARHPVPELVHGSGGMAFHEGRFIVVGGLPPGVNENYLYEYDMDFHFIARHVLASGYTLMGIQTITWARGLWWMGCYGKPPVVLRADEHFQFSGKWEFNGSVGLKSLDDGRFYVGVDTKEPGGKHSGKVLIAVEDPVKGLRIIEK
jgi:hypothetical protein